MPHLEKWKMPPIAKVYEALSAVADGRVQLRGDNTAVVRSSDGTKDYTVKWSKSRKVISSTDNASKFGHYIGYPIIAVLIELGDLAVDRHLAGALSGVPWKQLNERHERDYEAAVSEVLERVSATGADVASIRKMAANIHELLESLELVRQRGGRL
jgi:hypothetical protein